jgi:hypothetical protein
MQINTQDFVLGLLQLIGTWGISALAGAGLTVLALRTWLSEKIKASIKSEYDEKLATMQAQLKAQYDKEVETHKAQLKRDADTEIEQLKSRLSIIAAQQQVKFSHLHETRAEVIAEVYTALQTCLNAIKEYTQMYEPVGISPKPERNGAAVDATNAFVKLFWEKQIFIPHDTAVKLGLLRDQLRHALIQFQYGVDKLEQAGQPATEKWIEITNRIQELSETGLVDLENDFRRLLGDDAQVS